MSYLLNLDSDIARVHNYDGQIEDGVFKHRFIPLDQTFSGKRVNVTYHVVECGSPSNEPIVFFHGLAESWRVWKDHMALFCSSHYVVGVDSEGMGQSEWDNVLRDLPKVDSRAFMADMTMALIKALHIEKFNIVVTDYSFWSTLKLLDAATYGDIILRYGKFQSTVGVEDAARVPQAMLFTYAPGLMDVLFSLNPFALPRILFGRTLAQWVPGLRDNGRAYRIPDENTFREVILQNVNPVRVISCIILFNLSDT
jgi:pimeloyl-ACP methyl ester carboxylesterase